MTAPANPDRMTCDAVRSRSFAACDDELTGAEFDAIDMHLHHCAACRARLTGDAAFLRGVRAAVALEAAPAALRDRVVKLLHLTATENASA